MVRSNLPVYIEPSRDVREKLGDHIAHVALLAIRAILKNRRSLEVAHQQIVYRGHHLALSSRISGAGDLVIGVAVGDPSLSNRLVLEEELRTAERQSREEGRKARTSLRKVRRGLSRW